MKESGERRSLTSWALVTFVVVAALSIGGWAVIRNGVARQNQALVKNGAAQVALVLQSAVQNLQTQLRSVAFFTSSSGYSAAVFHQEAKPLLTNPAASVALVDVSGPAPRVVLAEGPALHVDQPLDPAVAAVAAAGSPALSSTIVHLGSATYVVLTATSTLSPKLGALEMTQVQPTKAAPNNTGPYRNFYIDLYNGTRAQLATLILTTYGPRPLPPPVADSLVRFGNITYLIQASAKSPPAGSYASASPWITLGVGLLVAIALAVVVETLARRNRHSAHLVELRTAELMDAQKTIVRQERLAAVGEMATVIGHELRNPMGAAINNLFLTRLALGDPLPADADRHLAGVEHQVNRAARLSEDLTAYMRDREAQLSPVQFSDLVTEVLEATPAPKGVAVAVDGSTTVTVDPALMVQVLTNLITNAYQAMPGGGEVRLSARRDPTPTITVEDTGRGIDPHVASRLFDPFFTTKEEGTGLGLAIVQRLVQSQGGTISVENRSAGGARVTISFPGAK